MASLCDEPCTVQAMNKSWLCFMVYTYKVFRRALEIQCTVMPRIIVRIILMWMHHILAATNHLSSFDGMGSWVLLASFWTVFQSNIGCSRRNKGQYSHKMQSFWKELTKHVYDHIQLNCTDCRFWENIFENRFSENQLWQRYDKYHQNIERCRYFNTIWSRWGSLSID